MKNNNTSGGGGIGFMGMLAIVFIALKLMKVITWSWWWVLAPLWVPLLMFMCMVVILSFLESKQNKNDNLWS